MSTSRRAEPDNKTLKERRALAEELIGIERKIAPDLSRQAAIEARLKVIATDTASFKEVFADGSYVNASGAIAAEFKGDQPVIVTETWRDLKKSEQNDLMKRGIVKIEPQWGRATSGRVTTKLFGAAA